jgi:hypothetical protein
MIRIFVSFALCLATVAAADWSAPAQVLHELKPVLTYRARIDGSYLIVDAAIEPGWHTFAIDNEQRAKEKLGGKASLGVDQPTRFSVSNGLEVIGPWYQLQPVDFSRPQLRWYSWGFEKKAVFAAKVRRAGAGPAELGIRGQACTDKTCKNIDVTLQVAIPASITGPAPAALQSMIEAR